MSQNFEERVRDGLATRLSETPLTNRLQAAFLKKHTVAPVDRRRRIVSLNLNYAPDNRRWQELHNIPDKYEIIDEKRNVTPKGAVIAVIVYNELGENLPIAADTDQEELQDGS